MFDIGGDVTTKYALDQLKALGETTKEYSYTSGEKLVTDKATGVLLADVLADAGITDPSAMVSIITTDGYFHDSYEVTLQDIKAGGYLLAYLVDNKPFTDTSKEKPPYHPHLPQLR